MKDFLITIIYKIKKNIYIKKRKTNNIIHNNIFRRKYKVYRLTFKVIS